MLKKMLYFVCMILAIQQYANASAKNQHDLKDRFFDICESNSRITLTEVLRTDLGNFLRKSQDLLSPQAFSALINATQEENCTMLRILVGKALDLNNPDRPLALITLEKLIKFSPNPHIGCSALHTVLFGFYQHKEMILEDCKKVFDLLKEINQDFNQKDEMGETPLDSIIRTMVGNVVFPLDSILAFTKALLEKGANPTISSRCSMNPLGWSAIDLCYKMLGTSDYHLYPRYEAFYNLFSKEYNFRVSLSAAFCTIL